MTATGAGHIHLGSFSRTVDIDVPGKGGSSSHAFRTGLKNRFASFPEPSDQNSFLVFCFYGCSQTSTCYLNGLYDSRDRSSFS